MKEIVSQVDEGTIRVGEDLFFALAESFEFSDSLPQISSEIEDVHHRFADQKEFVVKDLHRQHRCLRSLEASDFIEKTP